MLVWIWKAAWRRLGWRIPDCSECGDSGWVTKETWIGYRGFRSGERCKCGGDGLKFL